MARKKKSHKKSKKQKKVDETGPIRDLMASSDSGDIYGGLIDAGKGMHFELEYHVVRFLKHDNAAVRGAAVRVLGFYWQMEKYSEEAWDLFLHDDDEDTRSDAIFAYAGIYSGKNKKDVMERLFKIVVDKDMPLYLRSTAYSGILTVSPIESRDEPPVPGYRRLEQTNDWTELEKLIAEAK